MHFDWILPLFTLTAMEIVLGIDNIIFITILVGRLPREQRDRARQLGLAAALGTRILLLVGLFWVINTLTYSIFHLADLGFPRDWFDEDTNDISIRDLVLLAGGIFLIAKSTYEIHQKLEGHQEESIAAKRGQFGWTLLQIAIL